MPHPWSVRVLVVEDEELLADAIARGLRREAIAVDVALDGDDALGKLEVTAYDVVVLDRDLPGTHGDDVCRHLVASGAGSRILMLTASGDVSDRVEGLELGADDYLPKPFAFSELTARVRALGRRAVAPLPPVLERAGIRLDPNRREVVRDGSTIHLSPKEFALLYFLARNAGQVFSRETLLDRVWGQDAFVSARTVDVHIRWLRTHVEDNPESPARILTVRGVGYKFAG